MRPHGCDGVAAGEDQQGGCSETCRRRSVPVLGHRIVQPPSAISFSSPYAVPRCCARGTVGRVSPLRAGFDARGRVWFGNDGAQGTDAPYQNLRQWKISKEACRDLQTAECGRSLARSG